MGGRLHWDRLLNAVRVLHVITGLDVGGAETMLSRLVRPGTSGIAHGVVSLRAPGPIGEMIGHTGVPVHTLDMRGRLPFPHRVAHLRRIVQSEAPDILHGWMPHGNVAAWAACAGRPIPLIWSIRNSLNEPKGERASTRVLVQAAAWLSGRPARIVYNSRVGAAHYEARGYDRGRTVIIPNGFDTGRFAPSPEHRRTVRAELDVPDSAMLVGLIARPHPVKDHGTFIEAAAQLCRTGLAPHYLLAGRGVDDGNTRLVSARDAGGLRGHMHFLGERTDVARLLAACDLGVLSSRSEGFPNVVGEAMACGVPCVVTAVGEAPWIVGDTGKVVPPRDPVALADGMRALLALGSDGLHALGAAARQRIEREYALPAVRQRYAALYHEVLGA
jgi:glycosyltransferase involved in cell wall biosynthesis